MPIYTAPSLNTPFRPNQLKLLLIYPNYLTHEPILITPSLRLIILHGTVIATIYTLTKPKYPLTKHNYALKRRGIKPHNTLITSLARTAFILLSENFSHLNFLFCYSANIWNKASLALLKSIKEAIESGIM